MNKRVLLILSLLIFSQMFFTTKPAMLENVSSQLMIAIEDIQLQNVEIDISQMGILPEGSIVRVWCLENSCLMDDFTTFMRKDQLKDYRLLIANRHA